MKTKLLAAVAACVQAVTVVAAEKNPIAAVAVPVVELSPSERPVPQTANWTKSWWMPRFEATRAAATNESIRVVFLGDSITHKWQNEGLAVWKRHFATGDCAGLNCGFNGDRTENVLWRLDNGQLKDCRAKIIVLMIGTNNTGSRRAPEETLRGIRQILSRLATIMPRARVVLMPIFPRGATAEDPYRKTNECVNRLIRPLADGQRVVWLDIRNRLVDETGALPKELTTDNLHLTAKGYEIWAAALLPVLKELSEKND